MIDHIKISFANAKGINTNALTDIVKTKNNITGIVTTYATYENFNIAMTNNKLILEGSLKDYMNNYISEFSKNTTPSDLEFAFKSIGSKLNLKIDRAHVINFSYLAYIRLSDSVVSNEELFGKLDGYKRSTKNDTLTYKARNFRIKIFDTEKYSLYDGPNDETKINEVSFEIKTYGIGRLKVRDLYCDVNHQKCTKYLRSKLNEIQKLPNVQAGVIVNPELTIINKYIQKTQRIPQGMMNVHRYMKNQKVKLKDTELMNLRGELQLIQNQMVYYHNFFFIKEFLDGFDDYFHKYLK